MFSPSVSHLGAFAASDSGGSLQEALVQLKDKKDLIMQGI